MSAVEVPIIRLSHAAGLDLPQYATAHAAGMDLMAACQAAVTIAPGERALIPTGIAIALPEGFEAQVRPRSGLAARHGVTVLNSPGTVDSDYRGEIKVILINLGQEPYTVEPNARIAQLVMATVTRVVWVPNETLPETERGNGGFGSTGQGRIGV
jgi:dUTP pyrophosphatase